VSVIILALLSLSMPLFRGTFNDLELKEAVSNISKLITFAQEKAIIDRRIYKISFDYTAGRYQLLRIEGEGQNIEFMSPKDRFGRVFYISRGIEVEGDSSQILFYPDGHCDNGDSKNVTLTLKNRNNKIIRLATTGILGNVNIYEDER